MANLSAGILRNVVSSVLGVDPKSVVLSGILPENYDHSTNNSGGNLYSSHETLKLYAYSSHSGLVEVVGDYSGDSQNADGTHNSEYRVNFDHCRNYKFATFFVELFHKEGWQQGSADWNDTITTLYGAPDWRTIERKEEDADSNRWWAWEPKQDRFLTAIEERLLRRFDRSTGSQLSGTYTRMSPELKQIIEQERREYLDEYLHMRGIIVDDGVAVAPQFTPSDYFMIRGSVRPMGDQNDIWGFVHGSLCHIHSMGNLSADRGIEPGWRLIKKLPLQ